MKNDFPSFEVVQRYKRCNLNGGCVFCNQKTVVITLWTELAMKEMRLLGCCIASVFIRIFVNVELYDTSCNWILH